MKQFLAFVMIAFLLPTTAALAKSACKDDKVKFCKDTKASGGNVVECLQKHMAELSDACKEKIAEKAGKEEKSSAETPAPATPDAAAPADAAAPGSAETKPE